MYNDVKSGIAGLASALKIGAEHVYIVIVKQQIVKAISDLLVVLILITVSIVLYNKCRKTYDEHLKLAGWDGKSRASNIDLDDTAKGVTSIFLGVGCAIALVAGIICFCINYNEIIMGFVNPEYGAMGDIITFVRNATGK